MTDRVDRRKIIPPAVLFSAVLFGCLSTLMRMVETYCPILPPRGRAVEVDWIQAGTGGFPASP